MTDRRTFRGRRGPTDRRLPKYNARRRKNHHVVGTGRDNPAIIAAADSNLKAEAAHPFQNNDVLADALTGCSIREMRIKDDHSDNFDLSNVQDMDHQSGQSDSVDQDAIQMEPIPCCWNEVDHLLNRIRRCRETIQLADRSIHIISNYDKHVLRAVLNCVSEWKAILTNHMGYLQQAKVDGTVNVKSTATAIFDLIQHALQCGPLNGSKAGYWKRCGSEVAAIGYTFLDSIVPSTEDALILQLTEKQVDALLRWKADAKKMAESNKPPCKSTMTNLKVAENARADTMRVNQMKKQRRLGKM
jgi:hypothetical protein